MKLYYWEILIFFIIGGCASRSDEDKRVYFSIPSEDIKIIIPVYFNDSIKADLIFDTGWKGNHITLDSSFLSCHPSLTFHTIPDSGRMSVAWSPNVGTSALLYENVSQKVKIIDTDITYNNISVADWKGFMGNDISNGILNMPLDDTLHVWELNFDHNYMEIHPEAGFRLPKNCLTVPLKITRSFIQARLPLQITCADGDTLFLDRWFTLDTGMPWDVVLTHKTEEFSFFDEKKGAIWTGYLGNYYKQHNVKATIKNGLNTDSLRIYTYKYGYPKMSRYLIGINFFKRFNVFIDLKNKRMGLQPVQKFTRVVNPMARRFHFSTRQTPDGKFFIEKIADSESNYYKTAGLEEGDELKAVDGKPFGDLTRADITAFSEKDTLIYDIIRTGTPMKIIVPVDKNEEQGD